MEEPGGSNQAAGPSQVADTQTQQPMSIFQLVKNPARRAVKRRKNSAEPLQLKNKYECLSDDYSTEEETEDTSETDTMVSGITNRSHSQMDQTSSSPRPGIFLRKPPKSTQNKNSNANTNTNTPANRAQPIIIAGKAKSHVELITLIKQYTTNKFTIKYTRNNTNLYLDNTTDKQNFLTYLKNTKSEYHTYTDSENKTHSFVLKGLLPDTSTKTIHEEIAQYTNTIKQVYNMNTEANDMYMCIFDKTMTITHLKKHIKHLMYVNITWDRVRNARQVVQCHRCQRWGHATANCGHNPRCLKCGKSHWTRECEKPLDTPPACANCQAAHLSSSEKCKYYNYAIESRTARAPQPKPQPKEYRPAPAPTHNPWTQNINNYNNNAQQQESNKRPSFPELRRSRYAPAIPTQQQLHVQFTHQMEQQQPQPTPPTPSAQEHPQGAAEQHQSAQSLHSECMAEFTKLQSQVNLSEMLRALKELNSQLQHCNDSTSKFQTYCTFLDTLHSYKI